MSNTGSRIVGGVIYEHLRYGKSQLIITGILFSSLLILVPFTANFITFGFAICYYYVSYGFFISMYPVIFDHAFGKQGGLKISLAFSLSFSIGCVVMSAINGSAESMVGVDRVPWVFSLIALIPLVLVPGIDSEIKSRLSSSKVGLLRELV